MEKKGDRGTAMHMRTIPAQLAAMSTGNIRAGAGAFRPLALSQYSRPR